VVAAVHGAVAGGGLGLIYVADVVIAAEGTRFATGFSGLGLSGDGGGTWFLPRLVGMRRAAELYFEQRVLDADEAAAGG
jgi:2-(1,2-epoxy-1,2-dihydrophenyl)acetyl-CoA isomerase